MRVRVHETPETAAEAAATVVAGALRERPELVLALAAGSTMVPVYAALAARSARERLDWSYAQVFDLDEYLGLAGDDPRSFRRFVREHLLDRVGAPADRHDAPDGLAPEPEAECRRYEAAIAAAGGLDLALLGIGRNGHLAFHEPGVPPGRRTHVATLRPESQRPGLPARAITMGVATMASAQRCVLVALGAEKAAAVAAMLEAPPCDAVPASWLQRHPDVTVVLDAAAAGALRRREIRSGGV